MFRSIQRQTIRSGTAQRQDSMPHDYSTSRGQAETKTSVQGSKFSTTRTTWARQGDPFPKTKPIQNFKGFVAQK